MEWTTAPGTGPGAELIGHDLQGWRILELGCGAGHNTAHLADQHGARAVGIDVCAHQIRRARSRYTPQLSTAVFRCSDALTALRVPGPDYDAICSVFGAVGLVDPDQLLPLIVRRLRPGGVLAFSVPHPFRPGRMPSPDGYPLHDTLVMPGPLHLPVSRWELAASSWADLLARAGTRSVRIMEFGVPGRTPEAPATLLVTAIKANE
ncbi:class I SAM-dependent methyltransferase [Streptomyces sp. NPDC057554]|uniref:class I SAM-dependent methyltransferase n=1 Tax=Streptomyces sp. NPDC057554 TaxID=3350538 RepID=UPI0036C7F296